MWESVELRDIRAFLVLADELHFGRTAERLGLTQSRVSQMIGILEDRLGGMLFARTSRRVVLTPLGVRLRDSAQPAYAELLSALAGIYAAGREISGELRLGILVSPAGGPALTDIIKAFESGHPNCRVQIVELALNDSLAPLRRGEVDLMAVRLPLSEPDLAVGPVLSREPRVVAVSRTHPFAARQSVSIEELSGQTVSHNANLPAEPSERLSPSYTPLGRPIPRARSMDTVAEILAAVASGELVHPTVPSLQDYYGRPGVVYIPLTDLPPSESALVWTHASHMNPVLAAFVQVAEQVLLADGPGA